MASETSGPTDQLPLEFNADGKSLKNPPRETPSDWYKSFQSPIDTKNNAFDFHIYYRPSSQLETDHAKKLHNDIRREFPELRVYRLWDKPVGPHHTAMFEVNVFTPQDFGALFGYLVANRGPLSVLVHPNFTGSKGEAVIDHTDRAVWMGEKWPLDVELLRRFG